MQDSQKAKEKDDAAAGLRNEIAARMKCEKYDEAGTKIEEIRNRVRENLKLMSTDPSRRDEVKAIMYETHSRNLQGFLQVISAFEHSASMLPPHESFVARFFFTSELLLLVTGYVAAMDDLWLH